MAKQPNASAPQEVPLKDPAVAAFLAWLIPGAGHFYQGRHAKAVLFLVCISGTFAYGMFLGGGRCVYAQWNPSSMRRYSYLCQIGAGLPALPALVASMRKNDKIEEVWSASDAPDETTETLPFLSRPWYMPPTVYFDRSEGKFVAPELDKLYRDLHRHFELGTVFTMIAGLLNLLVVYDAWGGPAYGATTADRTPQDKTRSKAAT